MSNSSLPQLNSKTPVSTDLTYVAKDDGHGWYVDSNLDMNGLKELLRAPFTIEKEHDYTILASECNGSWFSDILRLEFNFTYTLPKAEPGLEVGFVLEHGSSWVEVKPNSSDAIYPINTVAGESIYGWDFGTTIYLRGMANGWHVVSQFGTWNGTGSSSSSSSSSSSNSCSSSCSSSSSSSSSQEF